MKDGESEISLNDAIKWNLTSLENVSLGHTKTHVGIIHETGHPDYCDGCHTNA